MQYNIFVLKRQIKKNERGNQNEKRIEKLTLAYEEELAKEKRKKDLPKRINEIKFLYEANNEELVKSDNVESELLEMDNNAFSEYI